MSRTRFAAAGLVAALAVLAAPAQAETPAVNYPSVGRATADPQVKATPAAPLERIHVERPRVSTEPMHSVFVYEALGATPRIRVPMPNRDRAEAPARTALAAPR